MKWNFYYFFFFFMSYFIHGFIVVKWWCKYLMMIIVVVNGGRFTINNYRWHFEAIKTKSEIRWWWLELLFQLLFFPWVEKFLYIFYFFSLFIFFYIYEQHKFMSIVYQCASRKNITTLYNNNIYEAWVYYFTSSTVTNFIWLSIFILTKKKKKKNIHPLCFISFKYIKWKWKISRNFVLFRYWPIRAIAMS